MNTRRVVNWTALWLLVALVCVVGFSSEQPGSHGAVFVGIVVSVPLTYIIGNRCFGRRRSARR